MGAVIVALTVISHWVLDALVHVPELSLWGIGSPLFGLDLWDHQPWALALEFAIALADYAQTGATVAQVMRGGSAIRRILVPPAAAATAMP